MLPKKELRKKIRIARTQLTTREMLQKNAAITACVLNLPAYKEASDIYLYSAINNEVRTDPIYHAAIEEHKRIYFPKVMGADMNFYRILSEDELDYGYMGIREPDDTGKEPATAVSGVIIVPGIAFDGFCNRLGYGKGFYDRFLSAHPHLIKIGLAYDFQVFDRIETDEHDIPLDYLVTENKIYQRNEERI